ncbi:MAG: nitrate ABC transporter substrate-binding protein [Desulfobacterales bacterium GWB2_56_26]|nr:MAG: nitrate ABC transporter substrate-binding protein [Desulfobacterales bacterium GWB2_56_26]
MRTNLKSLFIGVLLLVGFLPATGRAVEFIAAPPLTEVVKEAVGEVKAGAGGLTMVPVITWGGDIATIHANGNSIRTAKGSLIDRAGLQVQLTRMDDFKQQVQAYMKGETPYLRGTLGMIAMASELLGRDGRTKPVIIYQHTWSNGGDCLVVKPGLNTAADLKGKTIALQAYGPHVDYLAALLKGGGLAMSDVKIKWVKDLTGTANSPAEALYDGSIDAAMTIIPDGLMLTSGGTVGTGSEGSVKGAKIMLSTKSANRVIADVYAVRSDYFVANKETVKKFVHSLLLGEQAIRQLFKSRQEKLADYQPMIGAAARILLDSESATGDAEALYGDCEYAGYRGNVKFFTDQNWPRNFARLTEEIEAAFVTAGLLSRKTPLVHATWNYADLSGGLAGLDAAETQRFNVDAVTKVVAQKQAMGTLGEGELFSFEVYFQPNQNSFAAEMYADAFKKVVELASTYGGAVITVEGHSDPLGYLRKQKEKSSELVLRQTQQAAKNLSLTRAIAVRDSIMGYAGANGVNLDQSQFTVIGHGITQPKTGMCGTVPCPPKTKEDWLSNMRVVFRIIQIEAEESAFRPLD